MYVKNKEMYHFNNYERRKDIWTVGNTIDTDGYIADFWSYILQFNSLVMGDDGCTKPFHEVIDTFLKCDHDKKVYMKVLNDVSTILRRYSTVQRELILEDVRSKYYPDLPSRKDSIYLCSYEQIDYWKNTFDRCTTCDLFKVSVTGELFKTSDYLIPRDSVSVSTMYEEAFDYWNADLKDLDSNGDEYLLRGRVKILEKL